MRVFYQTIYATQHATKLDTIDATDAYIESIVKSVVWITNLPDIMLEIERSLPLWVDMNDVKR